MDYLKKIFHLVFNLSKSVEGLQNEIKEVQRRSEIKVVIDLDKVKGKDGEKGEKGETPKAGVDFLTPAEVTAMERSILAKVPKLNERKLLERAYAHLKAPLLRDFLKAIPTPKSLEIDTVEKLINAKVKEAKKDFQKVIVKQTTLIEKADMTVQKLIDDPRPIVKSINKLRGDDRIDAKAIKNLPKSETVYIGGVADGGSSGAVVTSVLAANLTSQVDGGTTLFTMPAFSSILQVSMAGWTPSVLNPSTDFTTPNSTSIQLDASVGTPAAGTTLIVLYIAA